MEPSAFAPACTTGQAGPTPAINPEEAGGHADQPEGWGEGDSRDERRWMTRQVRVTMRAQSNRIAHNSERACESEEEKGRVDTD